MAPSYHHSVRGGKGFIHDVASVACLRGFIRYISSVHQISSEVGNLPGLDWHPGRRFRNIIPLSFAQRAFWAFAACVVLSNILTKAFYIHNNLHSNV
jgi:hypothetical protein